MLTAKKLMLSSLAILALSTAAGAGDRQSPLSGDWVLEDGKGVLEIRGAKWRHPEFGAASIKRGQGAADIEVFYHKADGMKCAYRTRFAEGENVLFLELAEGLQSMEYCPRGKLTRVGG